MDSNKDLLSTIVKNLVVTKDELFTETLAVASCVVSKTSAQLTHLPRWRLVFL